MTVRIAPAEHAGMATASKYDATNNEQVRLASERMVTCYWSGVEIASAVPARQTALQPRA